MKKKSMLATVAGAVAVGLGMVSAPSTQQVIEQVAQNETTVQQQANQQRTVRSTQQQARQINSKTVRSNGMMNPYLPVGGGGC